MGKIKIKAKVKGDILKAKIQIKHDMLTYDQAKKKKVQANFITHITGKVGDKVILDMSTSQFLSKNPILKFQAKADGMKDGDKLEITYTEVFFNSDKTGEGKYNDVTEAKKIKGLK